MFAYRCALVEDAVGERGLDRVVEEDAAAICCLESQKRASVKRHGEP